MSAIEDVVGPDLSLAPNKNPRQVSIFLQETTIWDAGAALTTKEMFSRDPEGNYRNYKLKDLTREGDVTLTKVNVIPMMQFAAEESEPAGIQEYKILSLCKLTYNKSNVTYYPIPFNLFMPYSIALIGGSSTTISRLFPWVELEDPILLPRDGNVKMQFEVPQGQYTLAAAAATNPHFAGYSESGLTLSSNRGFGIIWQFHGFIKQPQ